MYSGEDGSRITKALMYNKETHYTFTDSTRDTICGPFEPLVYQCLWKPFNEFQFLFSAIKETVEWFEKNYDTARK